MRMRMRLSGKRVGIDSFSGKTLEIRDNTVYEIVEGTRSLEQKYELGDVSELKEILESYDKQELVNALLSIYYDYFKS